VIVADGTDFNIDSPTMLQGFRARGRLAILQRVVLDHIKTIPEYPQLAIGSALEPDVVRWR